MAEEHEALIDVQHGGLFRCQPQSQGGEHGRHLLAQGLGVAAFTRHHQDEVVAVADEPPVALAVPSALGPLPPGFHLLLPLPVEVIVQCR